MNESTFVESGFISKMMFDQFCTSPDETRALKDFLISSIRVKCVSPEGALVSVYNRSGFIVNEIGLNDVFLEYAQMAITNVLSYRITFIASEQD